MSVSKEDIQYHSYVRKKIQNGINSITNNKVFNQKEAKKRMDTIWADLAKKRYKELSSGQVTSVS